MNIKDAATEEVSSGWKRAYVYVPQAQFGLKLKNKDMG